MKMFYQLSQIYQADENVGSRLVNVTDVTFTKGSVIVDFFLWVDSTLGNKDVLQDILRKVPFSIGGHAVDLKSVIFSDIPWLPMTLVSVIAGIMVISLIVVVVCKCNKSRDTRTSSDVVNQLYSMLSISFSDIKVPPFPHVY
ncbi:hypothetical protein LSAT2_010418 [Lamellibrachia satsuma]|nr:hypothetical protein LSAT2_010418 [Lamellibrachia satsuma]